MEIKVKDHEHLVRDLDSGAIINKDIQELLRYRKRKLDLLKEQERDREIAMIKNELKDLKAIVVEIYERLNKTR